MSTDTLTVTAGGTGYTVYVTSTSDIELKESRTCAVCDQTLSSSAALAVEIYVDATGQTIRVYADAEHAATLTEKVGVALDGLAGDMEDPADLIKSALIRSGINAGSIVVI